MRSKLLAILALLSLAATPALAGGPLIVQAPGVPYAYAPGTVDVYTDLGGCGLLTNAQADGLTANGFAEWSAVPTAYFSAAVAGDFSAIGLPDIIDTNAGTVVGTFNGGGIHVVYDDTGDIFTNFFGAPPGVLGIASPDFASGSTLTESWAFINGTTVDPGDTGGNSFAGVFTHEFGHSINMAHTQVNGATIFFGDASGPDGCARPWSGSPTFADMATMYPFIDPSPGSTGVQQATVEHPDDTTTLSDIYPDAGWPAGTATFSGTVFASDGTTPLGGINVIARNVADPYADAVSALSGDFSQTASDGSFELTGLTPGGDYVLFVNEIVQGGFSQTPLQPLPGPEEYWNTPEDANPFVDDPCAWTTVNVAADQVVNLDVVMNLTSVPPDIAVSPGSFSFTLPTNSVDTGTLDISNVGGLGADDLVWTVQDASPLSSTILQWPRDGSRPQGVEERRFEGDATLMRNCPGCGQPSPVGAPPVADGPVEASALANLVSDPGFELGTGGPWAQSSTNFGSPLCDSSCGVAGARTGNWWCWFGGIPTFEDGAVSQSVTFPAGGTLELSFWLLPGVCDSPSDFMELTIDGSQVFVINGASGLCGASSYSQQVVDISAWADGNAHTVRFHSTIFGNNGGGSNFWVDDVSIEHTPAVNSCPWLSASPTGGTTPEGATDSVTLTVDSSGLAPGTYDCSLRIDSNDPDEPVVTVPVQLVVTDAVDVDVSVALQDPVTVRGVRDGSGPALTQAQQWDFVPGSSPAIVDATITVTLTDGGGSPVVGHPADQIRLLASAGGFNFCAGTNMADAPTDANGQTTFSAPLLAGGYSGPGELMQVEVLGLNVGTTTYSQGGSGLDIRVNSADINGDGDTNLSDVSFFSIDYSGPYNFRSDLAWNGAIDLVDVSRFSVDIGASCPPAPAAGGAPVVAGELRLGFGEDGLAPAAQVEPGERFAARLWVEGPAAQAGIGAFELALDPSHNLVVHDVQLAGDWLDLGSGNELIVGTAGTLRSQAGERLLLAVVELEATDEQPASLAVGPSRIGRGELPGVDTAEGLRSLATSGPALVNQGGPGTPERGFALSNVPNPFNPSTEIRFRLPREGQVVVDVLDVSGRVVDRLDAGLQPAGEGRLQWSGTDRGGAAVRSGIYYYRLVVDGEVVGPTRKMNLIK